VWYILSIFIAAMAGGVGSSYVSNEILLFLFAGLAFSAAFLMLVPVKGECDNPDVECLTFHRWRAVTAASGVGLIGGLVGQGGSFMGFSAFRIDFRSLLSPSVESKI